MSRSKKYAMIFTLSVVIGIVTVLGISAYSRYTNAPITPMVDIKKLTSNIWVSEQITVAEIPQLRKQGIKTIIDLRPDGEAVDQPSSMQVGAVARDNNIAFSYVAVPHGDIPDKAVTGLAQALANNPQPVLLYCRSGKRAARTWSLVEASRVDGLDVTSILSAVKASGQSADDLEDAIKKRIAGRK